LAGKRDAVQEVARLIESFASLRMTGFKFFLFCKFGALDVSAVKSS